MTNLTPENALNLDRINELYPRIEDRPWTVGVPIAIGDSLSLRHFEDDILPYIDQSVELLTWQGRPHIDDHLRPKNSKKQQFNGRLANITLISQENAQLLIRNNTMLSINGKKVGHTSPLKDRNPELAKRAIGFTLSAEALSTGRGTLGVIESGIVYAPIPFNNTINQKVPESGSYSYGIRRFVINPTFIEMQDYNFEKYIKNSCQRAIQLQKKYLNG